MEIALTAARVHLGIVIVVVLVAAGILGIVTTHQGNKKAHWHERRR